MTEKSNKGTLGDILSASQIIREPDILKAIEEQKRSGCRFGEALVNLGLVTQEDIDWALSNQLDIPYIHLKHDMIDIDALALVPAHLVRRHNFIPLIRAGNELNIAISDPLNRLAIEEIERHTGLSVNISVALTQEIQEMADLCYGEAGHDSMGFDSPAFPGDVLEGINADITGQSLLDRLLEFIIENRLSSLSLQPSEDVVIINAKRSGTAKTIGTLLPKHYPQFTLQLHQATNTNQTGCQTTSGILSFPFRSRPVTFQVATMPCSDGEYITIRQQITSHIPARLTELHLPREQESAFRQLSHAKHGITFFASRNTNERCRFIDLMLEEADTNGKHVIILGDGPGRMHKRFPRVKLPASEAERAGLIMDSLDHDPDILVIEDATEGMPFTSACRAAMRGKLVLAGLEIRGTRNVLRHLLLYQQKNYFLPVFVNGLVSFKGIQMLCPDCRTEYTPPGEEIAAMHLMHAPVRFYRTTGCEACAHSGFIGRRFLMDNIVFDNNFLEVFEQANDLGPLDNYLLRIGYRGIEIEGLELLHNGDVSPEEYIASVVL